MVSGLDLLSEGTKTGVDLLEEAPAKSGLELLESTETPSKTISKSMSKKPTFDIAKQNEEIFKRLWGLSDEQYAELEAKPVAPRRNLVSDIVDSLKADYDPAANVTEVFERARDTIVDTAKGLMRFVGSLPGFAIGLTRASQNALETFARGGNVEDMYEFASQGMAEGAGWWEEKLVSPAFGTPSNVEQGVGTVVMMPFLAMSKAGQEASEWPRFKDNPNIRGLARFAGDIAGLVLMGRLYGKGKEGEAIADVDTVVRKARDIKLREQVIDQIPDKTLQEAQRKVAEIEKKQLELEAAQVMEKLDYGEMIKEDLRGKRRQVGEVKLAQKRDLDLQIDKAIEGIPISKYREAILAEENRLGRTLTKNEVKDITLKVNMAEVDANVVKAIKKKGGPSAAQRKAPGILTETAEEFQARWKTNDVDLQTGTREPVELSTEKSPFRETPEHTQNMKKLYAESKGVYDDVEIATGELVNRVNRWLDGEEVDITNAREMLSEFAARADELRGEFDEPINFEQWRETVSEAAQWARKADRPKIGQTGTKLYDITGATGEAAKQLVAGARKLSEYTKTARGMKGFKPTTAAKMLREEFTRTFIDRSGNIRRKLLDALGNEGYEIVQKMYLAKGASSWAANMLSQMRKEVYGGLSRAEKGVLDNLVLANRMVDIGKYKTEK